MRNSSLRNEVNPSARAVIDGFAVCIYVNVYENVSIRLSPEDAEALKGFLTAALEEVPRLQYDVEMACREAGS